MSTTLARLLCGATLALAAACATANAADWANLATVSMTDPITPKLTSGYGCRTDGKDIVCDSAASAVSFGSGGLIDYGGLTVSGVASLTAVSASTISATLIQPGQSTASCTTVINGALRYSAPSSTLQICTGTTWTALASGTINGTGISGGSATAVAFWNGPNSITYESATTSGLYWDPINKRLGIGTNAPSRTVYISDAINPILELAPGTGDAGYADILLSSGGAVSASTWQFSRRSSGYGSGLWFANYPGGTFTPRMVLSTAGNVGFGGVVTPTATVQVSGSFTVSTTGQNSLASASLVVDGRGVSVSSIVHITGGPISPVGAGGNVILSGTTTVSTSSDGKIGFYSGGLQRMQINGTGNIGIGTDASTSEALLVSGSMAELSNGNHRLTFLTSGSGIDLRGYNANLYINFYPGSTTPSNTFINAAGGFVGIGTTSPGSKLTIAGDSTSTWTNNALMLVDTASGGRTYSVGSRASGGVGAFVIGDETAHIGRLQIAPNGTFTLLGVSTCVLANGTGTTSCTSDRRLKDRIEPIRDPLDKLLLIKGVTFHWKRKDISAPEHIGVIAQDVEKAFPQAVTEVSDTTIGTAKTVDYSILVAPIIEVLREFKHRFENNEARVEALSKQVRLLQAQVEQLQQAEHQ